MEAPQNGPSLRVGIIEEPSYAEAKERCGQDLVMGLEEGFSIVLAVDPFYGAEVPGHDGMYIFVTRDFSPRVKSHYVLYKYRPDEDSDNVYLLAISQEPDDTDGEI